jgi:hypothetical protein
VYTAEELESLKRFHVVWETTADALSDDYPPLDVVLGLSQWESLRKAAESALTTFALRGKLPEDHAAV